MKKLAMMMVVAVLASVSLAYAEEKAAAPVFGADLIADDNAINVEPIDGGKKFRVTIKNPKINPEGNSDPEKFLPASVLVIGTGIGSGKGDTKKYMTFLDKDGKQTSEVKVVNGVATFDVPNYALMVNADVVEHLWAKGKSANGVTGDLVLYPNDIWVAYDMSGMVWKDIDYKTLAIGLVMYKDGKVAPLMKLGRGKLPHGKYKDAPAK